MRVIARMIEIESLFKSYHNGPEETEVLRDVNLRVEDGEFVSIVGPSGSGKSTLMNIIGCLDRPSRGKYRLDGHDISRATDNQLAEFRQRHIGFVFQSFNLLPQYSALENVELALLYGDEVPGAARRKARELLESLGMANRTHHRPSQLSGGQKQRVAIARAMANSPQLILADEPTGSLDTRTGAEVLAMFRELNRGGKTIVVVTHDPEVARQARRTISIRDGVVQEVPDAHS
jgi:putative ABC transport system ATP-binding protein